MIDSLWYKKGSERNSKRQKRAMYKSHKLLRNKLINEVKKFLSEYVDEMEYESLLDK